MMSQSKSIALTTEPATTALIEYPRFRELHAEIQLCQRLSKLAGEPHCMSLEGRTGTGKSTLVRTYAESFRRIQTRDGTQVPVLYMEVPSPVGIKDFASTALQTLGDPAYDRGTRAAMTRRLIGLLKDCQVELIILDDFQHLIDSETQHILAEVSDWLKYVIKETGVPFLVVGIEGKVEVILQANPQLSRLFAARETLRPFAWEVTQPQTIQDFSRFVTYVEQIVGKPLAAEPRRVEWLYRLHYATEGIVGNLMNVMRFAAALSELQGRAQLDLPLLALAFQQRLSKHLSIKVNPFTLPASESFIPPMAPAPSVPQTVGRRSRSRSMKSLLVAA